MKSAVREPAATKRVRWTVKDYFRMSKAGVFGDRRVELLDGEIIEVNAQANPHRLAISKGARLLFQLFPPTSHWVVVQGTLLLTKYSAPDPDLHVFNVPEGTADADLPKPILVIEVSDTSYRKDAGVKLRAYAAAGVADYWIVNIPAQRVEVYRGPANATGAKSGWHYAQTPFYRRGESVQPLARPDVSLPVDGLLP
jgi:Uma2 family endonuclease